LSFALFSGVDELQYLIFLVPRKNTFRGERIGDNMCYIVWKFEMASRPTSPLPVGQVLEISFAAFTPRITIHSERELTVEIVAGDNIGFSDTVEYHAVAVRDGLVILSW
jgi:hypothetical protein